MTQTRPIRAAMIGSSLSIFPAQLCAEWRKRGIDVTLFTGVVGGPKHLPDGTPIVEPLLRHRQKPWQYRLQERAAKVDEWIARRHFNRYRKRTGLERPNAWEWQFYANFNHSFPIARAVRAFQPDFVFAQELLNYGFAAACCGNIPKFLFPWGADVFWCPEVHPLISLMVRASMWRADLVMPTSQFGVDHIARRFQVPREKLMPVSWGADLSLFRPADGERRQRICARWKLPPDEKILLNARRLRPQWGSLAVFEAFLKLARQKTGVHFVMLGGEGTEETARACRKRAADAGLSHRFTIAEGNTPLADVADLMAVASVYTSAMGQGDMRSLSVVQAAAAGGAPVLAEHPEYANMQRQGFAALFARKNDPDSLAQALNAYLDNESFRSRTVAANLAYVAKYEDERTQMDLLLHTILRRLDRPSVARTQIFPQSRATLAYS